MKRVGGCFECIPTRGNLGAAFHRAALGKRGYREVRSYQADLDANLNNISRRGGVINRCCLGVPCLGMVVYPDRVRLDTAARVRFNRRLRQLRHKFLAGDSDELTFQRRATAVVAWAAQADDGAWRRGVVARQDLGDAPQQARAARRHVRQSCGELPVRDPQQEAGG